MQIRCEQKLSKQQAVKTMQFSHAINHYQCVQIKTWEGRGEEDLAWDGNGYAALLKSYSPPPPQPDHTTR